MENYISIKQILDNVLDHPLLQNVTLERAVRYAVDFMKIVGMPPTFLEKVAEIEIKDWKGHLPCDIYNINQVRTVEKNCEKNSVYLRYSTDTFHMSHDRNSFDPTYKVQGSVIFTSFKEGTIEISYQAYPVDEDGFIMLPDNSSFTRALELYIKKQYFMMLFEIGKIHPQVYQSVQQEYAFAVAQAQSSLIRPTIDQMQSITNSLNTLIPRIAEHSRGFIHNGTMEKIRRQ